MKRKKIDETQKEPFTAAYSERLFIHCLFVVPTDFPLLLLHQNLSFFKKPGLIYI